MSVFRAVENRTYLVRAANTGISAIVAPDGRIVRRSGLFTREVLEGAVTRRRDASPYTTYGAFAWACAVFAVGVSGSSFVIARRNAGTRAETGERGPR